MTTEEPKQVLPVEIGVGWQHFMMVACYIIAGFAFVGMCLSMMFDGIDHEQRSSIFTNCFRGFAVWYVLGLLNHIHADIRLSIK